MPIPVTRRTGYALAYGSLAAAGGLIELYLHTAWTLPAAVYLTIGLALAAAVLWALVLAAHGVRHVLSGAAQPGALLLDFLPLCALLIFWML